MFDSLSRRLQKTLQKISFKSHISEKNITDTLRDVRKALLDADVAWEVVKPLIQNLKQQAVGQKVKKHFTPSQVFIRLVQDNLTSLLGEKTEYLNLKARPPAVILLAGLQGAGKTTVSGKLAHYLMINQKKKVMMVSCDIYRPAAIQQLEILAKQVGATFFSSRTNQKPEDIASIALQEAKKQHMDVLIIDTAGRLHVNKSMMNEISNIYRCVNPVETLFIVDGMTGQDAAKISKTFNDSLPLTGIILTKMDGDTRGGAALSIREITGKPIKLISIGEQMDALDIFHPDRIASRILGMGDIVSLMEEIERKIDHDEASKVSKKMAKGYSLDLQDLRYQLLQMQDMGGMKNLIGKLPGMGNISETMEYRIGEKHILKMLVIIDSMTLTERQQPQLINGSRKRRIAKGSGTDIQSVNKVLKQHQQMQKMFKRFGKQSDMQKMMETMQSKFSPKILYKKGLI